MLFGGLRLVAVVLGASLAGIGSVGALPSGLTDWTTIESSRFGFSITYPGSVFTPDDLLSRDGAYVLVSRDARAKLLVATFENEDGLSLEEYRQHLVREQYRDAVLDFTPVRAKWFVLSGTQGETHFYYRVSFTCGGQLINSWALIYPVAERRFYDRIVEVVARSYRAGAGPDGECG
jgi:hypothetical protein